MESLAELETDTTALTEEYARWEATVLHRVETGNIRLPVMPSAAGRALEMANDPNVDTKDLTKLLESDPAMAANILRVAASAAYGSGNEIRTLDEAVSRIGTRTFCQLVGAFAIQGEVYGRHSSTRALTDYKKHSLATAGLASKLARPARIDGGTAFLAGLLYTIGKPVIWHLVNDLKRLLGGSAAPETVAALVENFHAEMTRQICDEWELPDVARSVCGRRSAAEDEDAEYPKEVAAVALADEMAHHVCGTARKPASELEKSKEATFLNLTNDDILGILEESRAGALA